MPDQSTKDIETSMGGPSHEVMALGNAYRILRRTNIRVLDLGCGDGRNAFLLAGLGVSVTAVDVSSSLIQGLRSLAQAHNRPIDAVVSDVATYEISIDYDAILAHGILHFLNRDQIHSLVHEAKKCTQPGGYNIYTISSFASDDEIIDDFKAAGHKNVLKKGELLRYYQDWEVVSYESYTKWDYHPGIGAHSHPIEKIVLRRPGREGKPLLYAREFELSMRRHDVNVGKLIKKSSPIGLSEEQVVALYGQPQRRVRYVAEGLQFSFRRLTESGYALELLFYGKYMIYLSNGIVSGVSLFDSCFFELIPSAMTEQP